MYESPIEKIYGEIQSQIIKQDEENLMYQVNQSIGYKVDKEELVKALQYDRNQYQKGYADGRNDVLDKIRAEIEGLTYYCCEVHPRNVIDDVEDILDKYKAESEIENGNVD